MNSFWFEYYPSISFDDSTLFFSAADRPGGFGLEDIWISTWQDTGWGVPVNAGPYVNSAGAEMSNSISADGTQLYFVTHGRPGGYGSWDIWVSTWEDTVWGPPANAGSNINTPYSEFTVNISFNGRELYFSSDRPGTRGDEDLWVSEWDRINGEWGPATNLGPNVNTPSRDYCPCHSADGMKLYFASWLVGHPDIFVSEWQDSVWGLATNLGPPVNTDAWENGPSISRDGRKLYFASGRESSNPGLQDIFVSEWVVGIGEKRHGGSSVSRVELLGNLPNPFNSWTIIYYSLSGSRTVRLRVFDTAGRLVRILVDEDKGSGKHGILWDGRNEEGKRAKSGVYFYRLTAGRSEQTQKMVLLR